MNLPSTGKLDKRRALSLAGTVLLVALVAPFVVYAVPQLVGASQSYIVLSSSMSPTIHAGDVVVVDDVSASEISEGDVITFTKPGGDHSAESTDKVTHRVTETVHRDGQLHFRTKGDANEEVDQQLVPATNVIGRMQFSILYLGYVVTFINGTPAQLVLIVVPAVLLVGNEIWSLTRTAQTESDPDDGGPPDGD